MSGIVRRLGREQSPQDSPLQSAEERQAGLATILVAHSSSGRWNLRSRNGLVLSDVGTPVYGVDPVFGSILQPTSDNYVRISGMPNTGYPFTVAMFARKNRTNGAGASRSFTFGPDDFGSYQPAFFHQDNTSYSYYGGGAGASLSGLSTDWTLVVCVFESDTSRTLINVKGGVLTSASNTDSVSIPSWPSKLSIGQSAWNPNEWFGGDLALPMFFKGAMSAATALELYRNPWPAFEPEQGYVPFASGGTDYPVTATDALTLADSASQAFSATGVAAEAMTLADSASNVAALGASGTAALTLADSATNVAALSATATDALTLADTLNATASGDYTAIGSDALTLADSASNVAALGATASDALTLADAASNVAALGATASDALTLADTLNASASGDYVVVATDALSLSDSVVAAYAAICIATDALTLADATSAAMAGEYAATATDALTLADAASNAAALGVSISEALTLAALVSALLTGNTALTGTRGGYGVQMQLAARRAQIQTGRRRN